MEIRRFGIGHRRPDGLPGSTGVSGSIIESRPGATIAELVFARNAAVQPHANQNATWMVVIEGGGFVRSGEQQTRVAAGEAVLFEPGEVHAAWTEHSEMRAIVVDLGAPDTRVVAGLLAAGAGAGDDDGSGTEDVADGGLRAGPAPTYDPSEGEPV